MPIKRFFSVLAVSMLWYTLPVQAADTTDVFYVVDFQKVIEESDAGQRAKASIEKSLKSVNEKIGKQKQEIQAFRDDVQKKASILSVDALDEKRAELQSKERDLARMANDEQSAIQRQHDVILKKIMDELNDVVARLADEEGYQFVIQKDPRMVLYVKDKYDITEKVLDELNDRKIEF